MCVKAIFFVIISNVMYMKKRFIAAMPILLILLFLAYHNDTNSVKASKSYNNEEELIIEANKDKELLTNKVYDNKFKYLEFKKDELKTSHFIDNQTGEEKDFLYYVKDLENFNKKIDELISLKYPKYISDYLINNKENRTFFLEDDKIKISFKSDLEINDLTLNVYYNEVKDYLDFTLLLVNSYENEDGYNYQKDKKTVALTFDDGPNGEKTNNLVRILNENKAHATFFMVGNKMDYYPDVLKNVLEYGNEIGSHSYNHKSMKRQKLKNVIDGENKTREIYRNITGQELIYTRPPYGDINSKVKESLDTIFITWNLDTEDWLHRDKNYIVNSVLENIEDGDIILMHDSYDTTVEAVEELLPKLYNLGFQVTNISELASLKNRTLEKNNIYRSIKKSSE